ncbi:hypothetical protein ACJMK2_018122 [Sinanodonta woodiana]|uniref:Heparan-sulfate 6-O-sulfotransferase n=1 Tax=Sinanodonta woodiana TaxID=1069815 RepID=A0ABD3UCF4_SINWO
MPLVRMTMFCKDSTLRRNKNLFILIFIGFVVYLVYMIASHHRHGFISTDRSLIDGHEIYYFREKMVNNLTFFSHIMSREDFLHPDSKAAMEVYLRKQSQRFMFDSKDLVTDIGFNIEDDVIVYLHIQKTSGTTFNHHLVEDLELEKPCDCPHDVITNPCYCFTHKNTIWLFSWFTTGWPCGLHADWTELHECIDGALDQLEKRHRQRRYFYITILRDPIDRYLSEWRHLYDGEHWRDSLLRCEGQRPSLFDLRPCFREKSWEGVSFNEFMECQDNLATNRMTRMIADLTKSNCYHKRGIKEKDRRIIMLESAKENLRNMVFFGLTDDYSHSKALFENAFGLKFKKELNVTKLVPEEKFFLNEIQFKEMLQYIELDVQLYLYAKDLFMQRSKQLH